MMLQIFSLVFKKIPVDGKILMIGRKYELYHSAVQNSSLSHFRTLQSTKIKINVLQAECSRSKAASLSCQSGVLLTDGLWGGAREGGAVEQETERSYRLTCTSHTPHDKINIICGAWPRASIQRQTASKKRINKSIHLHQPLSRHQAVAIKFPSTDTFY